MEDIKRNYRITMIFTDEIVVERFETEDIAIKTVTNVKELLPNIFVGGAIEKKGKKWEVIWTTGAKKN